MTMIATVLPRQFCLRNHYSCFIAATLTDDYWPLICQHAVMTTCTSNFTDVTNVEGKQWYYETMKKTNRRNDTVSRHDAILD
jgi:hypothetical protein